MDREPNDEDVPSGTDRGEEGESKRARALVFLVAAGFFVVGVMDVAVYWLRCRHRQEDISVAHCLVLAIPILIGLVILLMTSALARAIGEYLDE
jgi:hypothetical protein